jgi:hypothetical protein
MKRIVRAVFACGALAVALDLVETLAALPGFFLYDDFRWVTFLAFAVMGFALLQRRLSVAGAFAAVAAAAFAHALIGPLIVVDAFHLSFGPAWERFPESASRAFGSAVVAGAFGLGAGALWNRFGPLPKPVVDLRTLVVLGVFIVALDAVEATAARTSGIAYGAFAPVQLVVYIAVGFVLRRRSFSLTSTALAAALTGTVEATAGDWVAIAIGVTKPMPFVAELAIVPLVAVLFAALACLGFALGGVRRGAKNGG